jgi:hypothetical protein
VKNVKGVKKSFKELCKKLSPRPSRPSRLPVLRRLEADGLWHNALQQSALDPATPINREEREGREEVFQRAL